MYTSILFESSNSVLFIEVLLFQGVLIKGFTSLCTVSQWWTGLKGATVDLHVHVS